MQIFIVVTNVNSWGKGVTEEGAMTNALVHASGRIPTEALIYEVSDYDADGNEVDMPALDDDEFADGCVVDQMGRTITPKGAFVRRTHLRASRMKEITKPWADLQRAMDFYRDWDDHEVISKHTVKEDV